MIVSVQVVAGTGSAVPAGPQGLSAYGVWLAAGNTGTISQFLASLVGPPPSDASVQAACVTALNTKFSSLPTTLPASPGVLWNNNGFVGIS